MLHKCMFAISPRLWAVRISSLTITPKVPNSNELIHTRLSSSKDRTLERDFSLWGFVSSSRF